MLKIHVDPDPEAAARARADILNDERLSLGATGLLLKMLSHAPDWDVNALSLARAAREARGSRGEGRDSMAGLFDELLENGYFVRRRYRAARGQFGTDLEVFDVPRWFDRRHAAAPSFTDVVYVIGERGRSVVKIGTTSSLEARLKAIQTGSPGRLEVLWAHAGDWQLETFLHEAFHGLRMEGEWFDFGVADPLTEVPQMAAQFEFAPA